MNNYYLLRKVNLLTVMLLLSIVVRASQTDSSPSCAERQQQSTVIVAAAKTKSAIEQFYTYLGFLNSIGDDPEDCVTSNLHAEISRVEKNLVVLEVGGQTYKPENLLHCNEVDSPTPICRGPELDDTLLVGETSLLSLLTSKPLPHSGMASVKFPTEFKAKILGVFAGNRSELQNGKPPLPISFQANQFPIQELYQWKNPTLIIVLHCDDTLRFRKYVWFF